MRIKQFSAAALAVVLLAGAASAQKAEITVTLNEAFFDALLDAVYKNFDPPEFSIAEYKPENGSGRPDLIAAGGPVAAPPCAQTVKILREMSGVRTAVHFRDGKVVVPLAFSGNYNPPFIGCVDFAGWAETNLDLEFDKEGQRLIARAQVLNVNLNGTNGVGGTMVAKMLQGSIDKRLNPIEILHLDKVSTVVPIRGTGTLKMNAVGVTTEVVAGALNVHIQYEFVKG